jgi:uncharacterized membrane protein YjgN (DUF898 family)
MQFDGAPAEYAKLWFVNLALLVLTVGLYFPWARARYWRFVHQHTSLLGQRFDYHADARRTWRPTWVFGGFLLLYAVASYIDPLAGFVAALGFAVVWPVVWRASAMFRAAQTSWCGLRWRFGCTVEEAYAHVGLPLVLMIFPLAWLGVDKAVFDIHSIWTVMSVVALVAWCALYPAVWWQSRRLKQNKSRFGGAAVHWRIRPQTLFRAMLGSYLAAVALLVAFVLAAKWSGVSFLEAAGRGTTADMTYFRAQPALWGWLLALALGFWVVVRSFAVAAGQRCLWSRSFGEVLDAATPLRVRVRTDLSWQSVLKLQARNTLLLVLTLGLYWPWARMRLMALRIGTVEVWSNQPLQHALLDTEPRLNAGSDLSADAAGADLGL